MRTTYITGSWQASPEAKSRDVTISWDDDEKRYCGQTVKGALVDPTRGVWRTLLRTRRAAKAKVRGDKRFSGDGPAMFAVGATHLIGRDGKPTGKPMSFATFVDHLLAKGGDSTWGSETRADRQADRDAVLAQTSWPTDGGSES